MQQTPDLHENGTSSPAAAAASRMLPCSAWKSIVAADAVADDRHLRVGGVAFARAAAPRLARPACVGNAEALDVDPLRRDAGREQRRLGLVVDAVRAADEGVVDVAGVDQRAEELADLVAAEPAVVERQVGRLLREHHVQRQARQVAVLQVLELLE